jgi:RNA polymerase sigma-70 factor (ECF subfamily)
MNINNFEKTINEFKDNLLRFAFYRSGSYENALDITQEVFIKCFEKNIDFTNLENPKSYLYKSIYNACIDYSRKQKINTVSIDKNSLNIRSNELNEIEISEEYKRIDAILQKIPDEQAEIVRLRIIDGLSFKEIAKIIDIPVATAKSRFKYGINKLKTFYKEKQEV